MKHRREIEEGMKKEFVLYGIILKILIHNDGVAPDL